TEPNRLTCRPSASHRPSRTKVHPVCPNSPAKPTTHRKPLHLQPIARLLLPAKPLAFPFRVFSAKTLFTSRPFQHIQRPPAQNPRHFNKPQPTPKKPPPFQQSTAKNFSAAQIHSFNAQRPIDFFFSDDQCSINPLRNQQPSSGQRPSIWNFK